VFRFAEAGFFGFGDGHEFAFLRRAVEFTVLVIDLAVGIDPDEAFGFGVGDLFLGGVGGGTGLGDDVPGSLGDGLCAFFGFLADGDGGVLGDDGGFFGAFRDFLADGFRFFNDLGGKGGGGRADMAQGGGPDGAKAEAALSAIKQALAQKASA